MDTIQISSEMMALLLLTGFFAGFVDSIAGGGGLISLPVLLFAGLPPQIALGTNKLQGSFGTLYSAYHYIKEGAVDFSKTYTGIGFTFIGALTGSFIVQIIDPSFVRDMIPLMLLVVLIYTFFSNKLGYEDRKPRMGETPFYILFGLGLGFYDGFFGPGTGAFWTAAFLIIMGFNMTRAAGYTRIMNFMSNFVALSIFALGGNVHYSCGICMALGQIAGARIGSSMAIRKGAGFIRPVFMTVVLLTIARLIINN